MDGSKQERQICLIQFVTLVSLIGCFTVSATIIYITSKGNWQIALVTGALGTVPGMLFLAFIKYGFIGKFLTKNGRRLDGCCQHCGYQLSGEKVCPECGSKQPPKS